MRRPVPLLFATAVVVTAACGGDDDTSTADGDDSPSTTVEVTLPEVGDRCETTLDPADYIDREIPAAVRPCETPEVLIKQMIRPGTGRFSQVGDGVTFEVTTIRAEDGAVVESSWLLGVPGQLPAVGVGLAPTAGLDEGLVDVQAGEILRLDVPPDKAYGDEPPEGVSGIVQPGDALTYVIEVLAVTPPLSAEDAPLDISIPTSEGAVEVTTSDLVVGEGRVVEEGDTVVIAILMTRGDNLSVFFNSWDRGNPLAIPLDPALMEGDEPVTLPGIFEGIQGATVGSRRVITMPPSAAWGEGGQPTLGLPPNTDVIVVADVLGAY